MKQKIPWPIKFAIKLLLGFARIDYKMLKRIGLVEHGRMEEMNFAISVFARHVVSVLHEYQVVPASSLLEVGPGDSIATGILGRAAGFQSVVLVDAGNFANLKPQSINRLITELGGGLRQIESDAGAPEVLAQLQTQGVRYLTKGVRSLADLVPGSVQFSFSNSVLQHVYRADLPEAIQLLARAHVNGAYCSHLIKFTDHFSGGFINQKLPDWFMESASVKRANLYTNRICAGHFAELFEAAGFSLKKAAVDFADSVGAEHGEYYSTSDLTAGTMARKVLRAVFWLRKA